MTLEQKIALACDADKAHTEKGRDLREALTLEEALKVLSGAVN